MTISVSLILTKKTVRSQLQLCVRVRVRACIKNMYSRLPPLGLHQLVRDLYSTFPVLLALIVYDLMCFAAIIVLL